MTLWLSNNGCAKIEIPNATVCGDAGSLGASCVRMLSSEETDLSKPEWDKKRFGWLCMSSDDFAEIKKSLMKACELAGKRCEKEFKEQVEEVDRKLARASRKSRQ